MPSHTLICFDYGWKRIGVAIGHQETQICSPLTTLAAKDGKPNWSQVTDLFNEWKPAAIIVGIPVDLDGQEMDITRLARRFANQIHGRYHLTVHHADERMSSIEANQVLKTQRQIGRKSRIQREDVDKMAAAVILQRWLENNTE